MTTIEKQVSSKIMFLVLFAIPMLRQLVNMLRNLDTNKSGADDKCARALSAALAAVEDWVNAQTETPLVVPEALQASFMLGNPVELPLKKTSGNAKNTDTKPG